MVIARLVAIALAVLGVVVVPSAGAATRPLTLGFFDHVFATPDGGPWLDRAVGSGARIVRVSLNWAGTARVRPVAPTDPDDAAYDWSRTDTAVAEATARGLAVLLSIESAPSWAEGARRPSSVRPGAWKPRSSELGRFAGAAARRYARRVRSWQIWNEPNLPNYLAPQWVRRRGRWRAFSPGHYRAMLNAAYRAIKAADRSNVVVTAGLAPYGDPRPGGRRIMPVRFWRESLRGKTRFDALSHHPYAIAGPRRRALNRDDAAIPDIHKLVRLVRRAVARGKALPRKRKRFWVTEISWDSKPPDPFGVPARRHAAWLADALYVLWKQGVDTVTWFQIRDQAPEPSFAATNQSGVYLRDGEPKLSQQAFAFPLACERDGKAGIRLWTLAPTPGSVSFADRSGAVVASRVAGRTRVVQVVLRGVHTPVRARLGDRVSLACSPAR